MKILLNFMKNFSVLSRRLLLATCIRSTCPANMRRVSLRKNIYRLIPVQHHHAHIVSCMVENGWKTPVIGVAFDGVGYGTDGAIWGGEFMVADWRSFRRTGQFEYVPMPGGAAAIKKPYRMALGYLYSLLGADFSLEGLPLAKLNPAETAIIKQQLRKNINCPLTSSAGRLFDAVAALTGLSDEVSYEAQAAIALEMQAPDSFIQPG